MGIPVEEVKKVIDKTPTKIVVVYTDGTTEEIPAGVAYSVKRGDDGHAEIGTSVVGVTKEEFRAVKNITLHIAEQLGV